MSPLWDPRWKSLILLLISCVCHLATTRYVGADAVSVDGVATLTDAASVSSYCDAIIQNFFKTYVATHIATRTVPGYDGLGATNAEGVITGAITAQTYWTSTYLYTEYPIEAYTAKPPCCSQCHLSAGTMRLIHWPDQPTAIPAATEPAKVAVDSNGFTMTYPSVYMAFSSLYASNKCGTVGEIWKSTTLGFDPDEISTLNPTLTFTATRTVTENGTETVSRTFSTTKPPNAALNYADITQNCSAIEGYRYFPGNPFNAGSGAYDKDPCHPILLLPDRLLSAQPAWLSAGCSADPGSEGFYDPPSIMTAATAFATPTSAVAHETLSPKVEKTQTTALAQPASTASKPIAKSTATALAPAGIAVIEKSALGLQTPTTSSRASPTASATAEPIVIGGKSAGSAQAGDAGHEVAEQTSHGNEGTTAPSSASGLGMSILAAMMGVIMPTTSNVAATGIAASNGVPSDAAISNIAAESAAVSTTALSRTASTATTTVDSTTKGDFSGSASSFPTSVTSLADSSPKTTQKASDAARSLPLYFLYFAIFAVIYGFG